MKNLDQIQGCLIGGAMGDALGYAVEFYDESAIFSTYGKKGITEYDLVNGKAEISDDTQMTLFTAVGLTMGEDYISQINQCYLDWLSTQMKTKTTTPYSWLHEVEDLHHPRAPGGTCLSALRQGGNGTLETPINDSKGCGGVMRVAPIGLYVSKDACLLGAKAAALTHGHDLGYIPSGMLAELIHLITEQPDEDLEILVCQALETTVSIFKHSDYIDYFEKLILKAIKLSKTTKKALTCIHQLGEGWVAEETLAIAIYCSLKYRNDFKKALIASVNHRGDSDSTGAVTGNILGAVLGYQSLPKEFLEDLELKETILKVAQELFEK